MSLAVRNLHVRLGTNEVLQGINFSVEPGERVAILGPNGCGKSTLLRTMAGILKPASGEVMLEQAPLASYRRHIRAQKLGLLNQADIIPMMTTVRDHVAIGRHPHRRYFRQGTTEDQQAIEKSIQQCEISHLSDRPVERLSGGERQRVRLATLLAQSPATLLLDEPLTGLDLEHQYGLLNLLVHLNQQEQRTVMVVLHDLAIAMRFFDRLLVIHQGRLVADGPPHHVVTTELLRSVFRIHASIRSEPLSGQPVVVCQPGDSTTGVQDIPEEPVAAGISPIIMASSTPLVTQEEAPMSEHPHHHGMPQATGFHRKLKEGTQALHDQAESGSFQVRMVNGELARVEFGCFLGQMRHIHATLDPALQSAAQQDERVAQIFNESHLRLGRVDQDLIDLDCHEVGESLPATSHFTGYITERLETNPVSLIGVLYVKEGATNGNKFIAKKLRETMGLEPDKAMGYLDPHGKDQRRCWNAFKETLNELELTDAEQEECVQVAQETFRMVMTVSQEVAAIDKTAAVGS
ncbi:MAG: ATP-binding cassette domain-containing protein [Phycisphaerales bacterium]|nr:ATP-binding cassette domain-containing protein [Phycisphaerales bacterium]